MNYLEHCGWHVLFLDREDTDRFFDAFDPNNQEVPSYLIRNGHRFIKEEIYEWLVANVGEPNEAWRHEGNIGNRGRELLFVDKDKAMLFKLTFQ